MILNKQQQQQVEVQQQQIAAQQQMHAEDMELKRYMNDSTNETKIQVAQIGVFSRQQELDLNGDGIPDPVELAGQALKEREAQSKEFIERLKLQAEQIKLSSEKTLKQRELDIKTKEIASREKIASEKAQTALKVAKTNKNKYDKK